MVYLFDPWFLFFISCGKSAAFDLTVNSPLNPPVLLEVDVTAGSAAAGSAAAAAELRIHSGNDG